MGVCEFHREKVERNGRCWFCAKDEASATKWTDVCLKLRSSLNDALAENQRLQKLLGEYDTESSPVGWTIVGWGNGSVLCQDHIGHRRRYAMTETEGKK